MRRMTLPMLLVLATMLVLTACANKKDTNAAATGTPPAGSPSGGGY